MTGRRLLIVLLVMHVTAAQVFAQVPSLRGLAVPVDQNGLTDSTMTIAPERTNDNGGIKPDDLNTPLLLRNGMEQNVLAKPFTLVGAVEFAGQNYPAILKSRA